MEDSKGLGMLRWSLACAGALLLILPACTTIVLSMRTAGEENISMPDEVAEEYYCDKRQLPFFEVEKNELLPERGRPGEEMSHRLIYVMCPKRPTEVVTGTLDTRILHKGKILYRETIQQDLKPGRWRIDTFVPLPEAAEAGAYALHIDFKSKQGNFSRQSDFVVRPSKK